MSRGPGVAQRFLLEAVGECARSSGYFGLPEGPSQSHGHSLAVLASAFAAGWSGRDAVAYLHRHPEQTPSWEPAGRAPYEALRRAATVLFERGKLGLDEKDGRLVVTREAFLQG